MAPGTPVFIGEQKRDKVRIDIIRYDGDVLEELQDATVAQCAERAREPGVTWISVSGVHDIPLIEALGHTLGLHALTLEDIANTSQRPKTESFPEYLFVVLKMMTFDADASDLTVEHVSLIVGESFVISFLEDEGDVFDPVRARIRAAKGRIRTLHSDFLAYSLLDTVVDQYFLVVERIGDIIEEIDDRILADPQPTDVQDIHRLKTDILILRKAVWPLREEIRTLANSDSPLIRQDTKPFLRDLYDHSIQVIDMVESFREILIGVHDTYLSSISNRLNEIMRVLTIISTIFIPLTFIVGVYGMNFQHMPELNWRWGYYGVWAIMIAVACAMALFFKRKNWL